MNGLQFKIDLYVKGVINCFADRAIDLLKQHDFC